MAQDKAMVREFIERIDGVNQTHFELEIQGSSRKKTLVVEVDFELDPNSDHYSRAKLDRIEDTFATLIREDNSDVVSRLKIVGRAQRSPGKLADATTGHGAAPAKAASTNARPTPN